MHQLNRILVADDDDIVRFAICENLRAGGFATIEALTLLENYAWMGLMERAGFLEKEWPQ